MAGGGARLLLALAGSREAQGTRASRPSGLGRARRRRGSAELNQTGGLRSKLCFFFDINGFKFRFIPVKVGESAFDFAFWALASA